MEYTEDNLAFEPKQLFSNIYKYIYLHIVRTVECSHGVKVNQGES